MKYWLNHKVYTLDELKEMGYHLSEQSPSENEVCFAVNDNDDYYIGHYTPDHKFKCESDDVYHYNMPTHSNFANVYYVANDNDDYIVDGYGDVIYTVSPPIHFFYTSKGGICTLSICDDGYISVDLVGLDTNKNMKGVYLYSSDAVEEVDVSSYDEWVKELPKVNEKTNDEHQYILLSNQWDSSLSLIDLYGLSMSNTRKYKFKTIYIGEIDGVLDYVKFLKDNQRMYAMNVAKTYGLDDDGFIYSDIMMDEDALREVRTKIKNECKDKYNLHII